MKNLTEKWLLLKNAGVENIVIISVLIAFVVGVFITVCFYLKYKKEFFSNKVTYYQEGFVRFLKNTITLFPVIIALVVLYYVFELFDYGDDILPNLFGAAISILVIDFVLKERKNIEKKHLNELLNYKINTVHKLSKQMILKYIEFDEYANLNLTKDLISNILKKENLIEKHINHIRIDSEGNILESSIPKIDYPYFIGIELRPIVEQLISNYSIYLDLAQITALIKLQEILNKNIFRVRVSYIKDIDPAEYELYSEALINVLVEINLILTNYKL